MKTLLNYTDRAGMIRPLTWITLFVSGVMFWGMLFLTIVR